VACLSETQLRLGGISSENANRRLAWALLHLSINTAVEITREPWNGYSGTGGRGGSLRPATGGLWSCAWTTWSGSPGRLADRAHRDDATDVRAHDNSD